jgi:hypothetical protein
LRFPKVKIKENKEKKYPKIKIYRMSINGKIKNKKYQVVCCFGQPQAL